MRSSLLPHDDLGGAPLPLREVVAMEVAPVVPIVACEDVHGAIILHARVASTPI